MSEKLSDVVEKAIRPALAALPARMRSREAVVMLLAIGLQESLFKYRRQMGNGPARGLWQFEKGGGVAGVMKHTSSAELAQFVCRERQVPQWRADVFIISAYNQLEHDDVLAAAFARLLLWTDPKPLPALNDVDGAWQLYLRTWRPGAYTRGTAEQKAALRKKWGTYYAQAMQEVSKMQRLTAYISALLAAAWGTWWLVALPRIELAELNHDIAAAKVSELQQLDVQRVDLIRDQQLQIIEITDNERRNRELLQTIAGQSRDQSRALQELKRNDETIAEYLRGAVPVELGRLYQRTATTDPSTYRQQTEVRTGPVPAARTASTTDQ